MKYTLLPYGVHPSIGTKNSAGIDFYIPDNFKNTILEPKEIIKIPLGVKTIIPEGYYGEFKDRSSIGSKGIIKLAGIIDSDYRGELILVLQNNSDSGFILKSGMKIIQLIIKPYLLNNLKEITIQDFTNDITDRNDGGFGSTN